jgi:hypothetical protein
MSIIPPISTGSLFGEEGHRASSKNSPLQMGHFGLAIKK